jgi:dipeptidyl aminopeptidase/acylaminoacyl peptidase
MLESIGSVAFLAFLLLQDPAPAGGWKVPPPEVVEIVDAPSPPRVIASPDAQLLLLVETPELPPLVDVARPWVGLAGVRIDPDTNDAYQTSFSTGILVRGLRSEPVARVKLPESPRIGSVSWSHDSKRFAFELVRAGSVDLYVADADPSAKEIEPRLVARGLNGAVGGGRGGGTFTWHPDGVRLLVKLVPAERGKAPEHPRVPSGPSTQETSGDRSPVRTYQDMLETPYDERLFEYFATSQLALVDPRDGSTKPLGKPGLITSFDPSPDGTCVLVQRIRRPFSYVMPWGSFPGALEVLDAADGKVRFAREWGPEENVPIEGVRTGPRSHGWQQSAPATLVWLEALDGGDPKRAAEQRDRWMALAAPFEGEPRELLRTQHRARGLAWMAAPSQVISTDYDRDRRWTRSQLLDLADPAAKPIVLDDRSVNDRYADPGSVLSLSDARGARLVRQDGPWIYRSGSGDSPGGARPFLDRQNLESGEVERLWRCAPGSYETLADVQTSSPSAKPRVLTVYESPEQPPNWRLRDLERDTIEELTDFPDPTPQMRGVHKELVTYTRADGVPLSATLYLPKDRREGERLPLLVWAYPLEYNDPGTAGQVRGSPHRFTRVGGISHLLLLTQGYAVLDDATMPIVGDPETMNDTFVEQIVASAQAAIDKAVEMGVADRERVAVGGHSYGAFMTANLLARCDLFKAGIARSGAYNRTLTPFGFQSERRTLWEAPEVYATISPFFHADAINEPLLLIHGEKDSNSGTFPIQSERLYQAIKGQGGTCRLVILPSEDHGYRSREATLQCQAEMIEWLDRYVKNAGAPIEAGAPQKGE